MTEENKYLPPAKWAADQVADWMRDEPAGACFRVERKQEAGVLVLTLARHPAGDVPAVNEPAR
ncbi:MAG: hypothetical protein ACOYXW_11155, partial [Actinomycetota bacterium]